LCESCEFRKSKKFISLLQDLDVEHADATRPSNIRQIIFGRPQENVGHNAVGQERYKCNFPTMENENAKTVLAVLVEISERVNNLHVILQRKSLLAQKLHTTVSGFKTKLLLGELSFERRWL
jgi:hypothetical protein